VHAVLSRIDAGVLIEYAPGESTEGFSLEERVLAKRRCVGISLIEGVQREELHHAAFRSAWKGGRGPGLL
jgi:hypothetical protein